MNRTLDCDNSCRRIRELCELKGLSVDDVAIRLSVFRQTVYYWFSGKKMPTVDHLIELADVLGVMTDDLLIRKDYRSEG